MRERESLTTLLAAASAARIFVDEDVFATGSFAAVEGLIRVRVPSYRTSSPETMPKTTDDDAMTAREVLS